MLDMFPVSDLSCNSGLYLLLDTLNDWLLSCLKNTLTIYVQIYFHFSFFYTLNGVSDLAMKMSASDQRVEVWHIFNFLPRQFTHVWIESDFIVGGTGCAIEMSL